MASRNIIIKEYEKIYEYLKSKSDSITELMKDEQEWEYQLIHKSISHSDLTNSGKRNGMEEGLEKNYLYYMTTEEMEEIEETRKKPFESAKQSNIFVPYEFYTFFDMPILKRREGAQSTEHEHPMINDYANVFLVNDTMKYFDIEYTKKVFEKLEKNATTWKFEKYKVELVDNFTPVELSYAIHGIGIAENVQFHNLRRSIFKNDTLILLQRKNEKSKELYIILEKNPKFYTLIGEGNKTWEKYLEKNNKQELYELLKKDVLSEGEQEKTRKNQNKWRNLLAEEMMNYTPNDDEIFCPLTYITVNFANAGTLFRASHIKEFSKCSIDEAFDLNNGIIMIANADALFDKHLITIEEDGTIKFSYLIDKDFKLKKDLNLTEKVFKAILTPQRLKYLEYHRNEFERKEEERKRSILVEDSLE